MAKINSGGTTANYTGNILEKFIESRLVEQGYELIIKNNFNPAICLKQRIYTRQFCLGKSIYGTSFYCDFILFHPQKWPDCLVIESKWQQSGGSVDEKYPYTVLNMKQHSAYKSILLLDGGGYKPGAEAWLRQQVDDKLLHIFNMGQFQTWCNKGNV
jgi:hypothetical protein